MSRPKTTAYAATRVSPFKTQEDIEKMLKRHSVETFRWSNYTTTTEFEFEHQPNKETPPLNFRLFLNWGEDRYKPQYFRALFFFIKSQIESVEFGLFTFTEAFLPSLVSGERTIGEIMLDNISQQKLLPPPAEDAK